jgi:hypothetical protein
MVLSVEMDTIVVHSETMTTFGMIPTRSNETNSESVNGLPANLGKKLTDCEFNGKWEETSVVRTNIFKHYVRILTKTSEFIRSTWQNRPDGRQCEKGRKADSEELTRLRNKRVNLGGFLVSNGDILRSLWYGEG